MCGNITAGFWTEGKEGSPQCRRQYAVGLVREERVTRCFPAAALKALIHTSDTLTEAQSNFGKLLGKLLSIMSVIIVFAIGTLALHPICCKLIMFWTHLTASGRSDLLRQLDSYSQMLVSNENEACYGNMKHNLCI